jgi:Fe-S-cluster-containing dehydrogenase component
MKTILVDVKKCIACRNCQLACKDEHVGNDWSPIAKPQSEGQFWIRVDEIERGKVPRVRVEKKVTLCQHCAAAPCIDSCKQEAIFRREDEIVLIDAEKCNGCEECLTACPYHAVYMNHELNIAQKCTLCAHLLDEGWKEPRCVKACPVSALTLVGCEEIEALGMRREALPVGVDTKPRVAYMGLPKPYGTGEVYAPAEDACLEGVAVTFTSLATRESWSALTNNYGDFNVEELVPSDYEVKMEKEGYYPKVISPVRVDYVADLGEMKLYRKP